MRRLVLAFVLAAATSAGAQQSQQPVFRSSVTLVTVDVTVLDKDGRPVAGLTPEEFQIKLNGKVQPVRAMTYVKVAEKAAPLTVTDIPAEVTGRKVITNAVPAGESKIFVIVVDDLSFAPEGGKRTLESAKKFVAKQAPDIYVGLTTTSGTPVVNPTRDHDAVVAGLKKVVGEFIDPRRPLTPGGPTVGIAEAIEVIEHNDATALANLIKRECGDPSQPNRMGQIVASKCSDDARSATRLVASTMRGMVARQVQALTGTITAMKGAPGLKQVVLLSEGMASTREVAQILEPIGRAAAEAGVQFSIVMEDIDETDLSDAGHSANELGQVQPDTGLSNRLRADKRMFQASMQTLAETTGGTFQNVIGDADQAFDRAAVAGSAVYRIGVEAPSDVPPIKPFTVSASVTRRGVTAHANRQAVLPGAITAPNPAEQVAAAIKEGQPLFSVPIRLAVAMRRASSNQVELGIGLEVPSSVKGPLTMTFGLVDQAGSLRQGSRPLPAPADNANYRLTFPMPVAPGKYHLRFAVTDADGSVGSIDTPIEAKLQSMGTLNASDVLTWWTDASGRAQFLALDEVPPGVATLGTGIELYPQPGASFPENVKVTMSLTRAGAAAGDVAPAVQQEVTPLIGDNMLRAEAMLPIATLPPGTYLLKASVVAAGKPLGEASAVVKK